MKTLVLGCNGQLGRALETNLPDETEYLGYDLPELDITNSDAVGEICHALQPDLVVNAAAYTAVDQAESEPAMAQAVNVDGSRNAALAARDVGAKLIHISTDFVFDGAATTPYLPESAVNPLSVYGRTKRDGELVVLAILPESAIVVRTAWLYSKIGSNFVKTMLRLMNERDEINVVADQFGTPTWADSLATTVWAFAGSESLAGIHHWTDGGKASWHDFAVAIQKNALELGLLTKSASINAIATEDYPTAAMRPGYSVLDCTSTCDALDLQQAHWSGNLRRLLEQMIT